MGRHMPVVKTHELTPSSAPDQQMQIYNALDCCLTFEIFEELRKQENQDSVTYNFERALQGPYLEIMLRGVLVDEYERREAIKGLKTEVMTLGGDEALNPDGTLQQMAKAIWDKPLNPRSHHQLKAFFYTTMKIPEIVSYKKGQRKVSMDREALEKLWLYFYARPIVSAIIAIRDRTKQIEILETEVDSDKRLRTSYNIAGTETGRSSSSENAFGTGGNLMNWPDKLRRVVIADPGFKLCVIDGEQAEARDIGFWCLMLFDDPVYLDAAESGDLHTYNCRLTWPDMPWTGDLKKDRAIAEQPFYRDFDYRFMMKKGGHGSTYLGKPPTIAKHMKIPPKMVEEFQQRFFGAYPCIPRLHTWTIGKVQTPPFMIETPFGRKRHFFGRQTDEATHREAVAFLGQSPTADRTSLGMLRIWQHFGNTVHLLGQTYDSVTFQYPQELENTIIPKAIELFQDIPLFHKGRRFIVPGEAKVGWNWSKAHDSAKPISNKNRFNPNGLIKYNGDDKRSRLSGLDRPL